MSIHASYTVTCDECSNARVQAAGAPDAVRQSARSLGWATLRLPGSQVTADLCSDCNTPENRAVHVPASVTEPTPR